jgi:hypothetical protein
MDEISYMEIALLRDRPKHVALMLAPEVTRVRLFDLRITLTVVLHENKAFSIIVTEHKLQEFEKNVQKAFGWKQGKETVI